MREVYLNVWNLNSYTLIQNYFLLYYVKCKCDWKMPPEITIKENELERRSQYLTESQQFHFFLLRYEFPKNRCCISFSICFLHEFQDRVRRCQLLPSYPTHMQVCSAQLFVTPWSAAHQTPLSMRFFWQEYWMEWGAFSSSMRYS